MRQGNILVVDDTLASLRLLSQMLRDEGYQVRSADNGTLALNSVAALPPDLILLDINMPGMDGFEVLRRLKGDESTCNIPVIILSSITEAEKHIEGLRLGAIDFLTKPYQREELIAKVFTLMELVQARAELERQTSELRTINAQLTLAKEAAEAASRATADFLANMSHEIRTPMNAILGFTEILKSMEEDPNKTRFIHNIHTSGVALLDLINDILDLSKIESGKMQLQYSEFSLSSLFQELKVLFSQKMEEKVLSFDITVSESIPKKVLLDEPRLRQVLINILSNAMKFTHTGFVQVLVEAVQSEGITNKSVNLSIAISDSGIGIPEESIDSIFGSFEQVKGQKVKEYGGSGLGLAISKRIVDLMGGEIFVESEIGKGSTFTVLIPDVEIVAVEDLYSEGEKNDAAAISFDPATVLIADDIDYNREILSIYLSDWQFTFLFAENGKEVLETVSHQKPDLILLDMKMPILDGYKASEKLKTDELTKEIPIIAVTASALKQDETQILQRCDGYIRKPVSKENLVSELKKFLPYQTMDIEETPASPEETNIVPPPLPKNKELYDVAMTGNLSHVKSLAEELIKHDDRYTRYANKIIQLADSYLDEEMISFISNYMADE